jgi:hypothetical protein
MTTAGDNITKTNIVASMETIRNLYNTDIFWFSNTVTVIDGVETTTTNHPFQTDITGGDAGGYAIGSLSSDISDVNITASTLVANFRGYANLLSRIRSVRLQKWYQNQGDPRSSLQYDQTNITNLNDTYSASMDEIDTDIPLTDGSIDASALDNFVDSLSTAINEHRTNTVLIEEFYCHSNCHGSCHGSL